MNIAVHSTVDSLRHARNARIGRIRDARFGRFSNEIQSDKNCVPNLEGLNNLGIFVLKLVIRSDDINSTSRSLIKLSGSQRETSRL